MAYQENYKAECVTTESINIISSRQMMSIDDFGAIFGKVFEIVNKENATIAGQPIAIYFDEENFDLNLMCCQ